MKTQLRQYSGQADYQRVSEFLITHHLSDNQDSNWLEPAWEYMHNHPMLDSTALNKIGIWETDGEIVGVCHYELRPGEAFFQFHPAYRHLREEMLVYAEQNLIGHGKADGRPYLHAYVDDRDAELATLFQQRGYQKKADWSRPLTKFAIPDPFPQISLAADFRLTSLAEECDWAKVHRVLWRGFNHPGDPPGGETNLEERRRMFDTPKARRDLKIAVAAPDGNFVAFCGMFFESTHRFAYVEPVATDPDYRRKGLGKAAVLEGIRRCSQLGATVAYVGSNLPFYLAIGFEEVQLHECWVKTW